MAKTFTGIEFRPIPAGKFVMGSTESDTLGNDDERPSHPIEISKPFLLCQYPVTVEQFSWFIDATGYKTEAEKAPKGAVGVNLRTKKMAWNAEYHWSSVAFPQTEKDPVVHVSWNDAKAFCDWLSQREGRAFRLPTEAEWEYACRAGTAGRFGTSDDEASVRQIAKVANAALQEQLPTVDAAPWNDGVPFTSPVGKFQPNAFGLYDMQGNVWEWCSDWYGFDYYATSPEVDPRGPDSGTHRVLRGGCWYTGISSVRCARRFGFPPNVRSDCVGFRVATDEDR